MENYIIVAYTQDASKAIRIRALINLKRHKFGYNQKIGLVGEVPLVYPNKLLDTNLDSSEDVLITKPFTPMNYLSVGKSQYLIVAIVYSVEDLNVKLDWNQERLNAMSDEELRFIKENVVDLIVVKGLVASQTCKSLNNDWKEKLGCKKLID